MSIFRKYAQSRWGRNALAFVAVFALSARFPVEMAKSTAAPMLVLLGVFGGVLIGTAGIAVNSLTTLVDLFATQFPKSGMSPENVRGTITLLEGISEELEQNVVDLFKLMAIGVIVHLLNGPLVDMAADTPAVAKYFYFLISFVNLAVITRGFVLLHDTTGATFTAFSIRAESWRNIINAIQDQKHNK